MWTSTLTCSAFFSSDLKQMLQRGIESLPKKMIERASKTAILLFWAWSCLQHCTWHSAKQQGATFFLADNLWMHVELICRDGASSKQTKAIELSTVDNTLWVGKRGLSGARYDEIVDQLRYEVQLEYEASVIFGCSLVFWNTTLSLDYLLSRM